MVHATLTLHRAAVVAVAACLLAISSCGGESNVPDARAVIDRALASFADRDAAQLCRLLSPRAKELIGRVGHRVPSGCGPDVRRFFDWAQPYLLPRRSV